MIALYVSKLMGAPGVTREFHETLLNEPDRKEKDYETKY
jgi:hypothetical protein